MADEKTRKPGLTYLGPAKPDDPVFKEGWLITFGLSGRRLSKPSTCTQDETSTLEQVRERQEDREAAARRYSPRVRNRYIN